MRTLKHRDLPPVFSLPVTWSDEDWAKPLTVRRHAPLARHRLRTLSCRSVAIHVRRGFTLIELLVVIAIIGILAALLFPALAGAKKSAAKKMAQTDAANFVAWVSAYQADYTVTPTPTNLAPTDFSFTNGNAEVMIILLDLDQVPNLAHARNPQRHAYAGAVKRAASDSSQGLGSDNNFRDSWGTPYIVSFDMDYDNQVNDPVYGRVPGSVLVWSAGPDRRFVVPSGPGVNPETLPENKDNILSWKAR